MKLPSRLRRWYLKKFWGVVTTTITLPTGELPPAGFVNFTIKRTTKGKPITLKSDGKEWKRKR